MFTESKVTDIYPMAGDFCKEFASQQEKYKGWLFGGVQITDDTVLFRYRL